MSDADPSAPIPPAKGERPELQGLDPGELLARGLHTVKPTVKAGPWEPPTAEEVSRLLPQYRIEKLVGRGGMGAVYKGIQKSLERPVAIKLLPAELTADKEFVARFEREARTLARLQHSRIVTIHDFGQTNDGHLYFVMEYIDGTDLRSILRGPGLNPDQALILVGQLCDALQAAHREGIVHRDIKPENVLVTRDGYVKLADFGLARPPQEADTSALTQTNMVMGTPDYMAPEQRFGASHADARSDIFALGVMLYEMLTGQTPRGVFDPPSRKVKVDVRIDEVVLKALQSEPERRYQKASEMRTDVERIRTTPPPSPAKPSPGKPSPPKRENRHSTLLAVAATAIVLLVAFAGYLLWPKLVHPSASPVSIASSDEIADRQAKAQSPSANPSPATNFGNKEGGAADRVWMMSVGLATPVPTPANVAPTPPPARIAASSYTVAEREILEKALLSHAWTWKALGSSSFPWQEVVFWKDGTMTTSTPAKARWTVTGPHSVALSFDTGDRMTLTFHFGFDYFTGCRDDGQDVANGWAKSGQVGSSPANVNPAQPSPAAIASLSAVQSSGPLPIATQAKPFVNSLWMKFVPVLGTKALFSVYETRVRDYAEYARNNSTDQTWQHASWNKTPLPNRPEDPILCVNLADANAFCRWLTASEISAGKLRPGMSYRLPTDAEWSLAVGLGVEEGRTAKERNDKNKTLFPWGLGFPPKMNAGNYADRTLKKEYPDHEVIEGYEDGFLLAAAVGSFAPNQFGIYDLGGNAAELCSDPFEPGNDLQLARGAAFSFSKERDLLASHRFLIPASARFNWIGFRCVLSASDPPRGIASAPKATTPAYATPPVSTPPLRAPQPQAATPEGVAEKVSQALQSYIWSCEFQDGSDKWELRFDSQIKEGNRKLLRATNLNTGAQTQGLWWPNSPLAGAHVNGLDPKITSMNLWMNDDSTVFSFVEQPNSRSGYGLRGRPVSGAGQKATVGGSGDPVSREPTQLANFVDQLPDARGWALAPLNVQALPIVRESANLVKTGLTAEGAKSPAAWRPVYTRALGVADLIIGALQEREADAARSTTPDQWNLRASQIRGTLERAETQFQTALQAVGGLSAFTGIGDTTDELGYFPTAPAASLAYAAQNPQSLEQALLNYTWEWVRPAVSEELTFHNDGTATCTRSSTHWKITGPQKVTFHDVTFHHQSGDQRVQDFGGYFVFDEKFTSFVGASDDGEYHYTGKRMNPIALSSSTGNTTATRSTPPQPAGIAIAGIEQDHNSVMMAMGGHSQELQDVRALFTNYGKESDDGAPHPESNVYPGIRYLVPWREAEQVLAPFHTVMRSGDKIACAGFPDGLNWVRYDGRWTFNNHPYNHLLIVKDIRSQVVCIELLQEHGSWTQDGWPSLPGNWHVIDYVNAEVKGQPQIQIVTQVFDDRPVNHRIVVHTTSREINRTTTMFVPEPLVNIMLYCTRSLPGK